MKEIIRSNSLCEIDVHNSQFALLAHLMQYFSAHELARINTKKLNQSIIKEISGMEKRKGLSTDMLTFIKCSGEGTLYEYIQEELGMEIEHRDVAKIAMMELTFSHYRNISTNKKNLKFYFPTVVEYFDTYKRLKNVEIKDGYKQLPILLQLFESEIFIDNIYKELKEQGLLAVPKHDSIIVRQESKDSVVALMSDFFLKIGLECRFKVSN